MQRIFIIVITMVSGFNFAACNNSDNNEDIPPNDNGSIKLIGSYKTVGEIRKVERTGNQAIISNYIEFNESAEGGIRSVDISNPASPQLSSQLYNVLNADALCLSGRYAYVSDGDNQHVYVADIYTPSSLTSVCRLINNISSNISVNGTRVSGNYLFVATGKDADSRIAIWNISGLPTVNPTAVNNYTLNKTAYDVEINGSTLLVAQDSKLSIGSIANINNPVQLGVFNLTGKAYRVKMYGAYACVSGDFGLKIIDISNPADVKLITSIDTVGTVFDFCIDTDDRLWLACGTSGIKAYSIKKVANPLLLGSYDTAGKAQGITVNNNTILVADGTNGLLILQSDFTVSPSPSTDITSPVTSSYPPAGTYQYPYGIILTVNEDAKTYYTINSSAPTTASTVYTGQINFPAVGTYTIQYFSVDTAGNTEAVKSSVYTITEGFLETPYLAAFAGTYRIPVTVPIGIGLPVDAIKYTDDGSDPKTSATVKTYTVPIVITSTKTIKAYAVKTGYTDSHTVSATYTIDSISTSYGSVGSNSYGMADVAINAADNTPWVAFRDGADSQRMKVKRWVSGTSWADMGTLSTGEIYEPRIAFPPSGGNPAVAFTDLADSYKVKIKKWNGSSWIEIGSMGTDPVGQLDITFGSDDTLFVAYAAYGAITIEKWTQASGWVKISTSIFNGYYTHIASGIDNKPYVIFQDAGNQNKVHTYKYNFGTTWDDLGYPLNASSENPSALVIDPTDGKPVLALKDNGNQYKAHVYKWSTATTWSDLGLVGSGEAIIFSMTISSDGKPALLIRDGNYNGRAALYVWSTAQTWNFSGLYSGAELSGGVLVSLADNSIIVFVADICSGYLWNVYK
jgi:hypothetical protein